MTITDVGAAAEYIVCMDKGKETPNVEGVSTTKCHQCEKEVWIAPYGASVVAKGKCKPVCLDCFIAMHKEAS